MEFLNSVLNSDDPHAQPFLSYSLMNSFASNSKTSNSNTNVTNIVTPNRKKTQSSLSHFSKPSPSKSLPSKKPSHISNSSNSHFVTQPESLNTISLTSEEKTQWDLIHSSKILVSSTQNIPSNERGWKTLRLFVSSTFADMHAEREHLMKVVFPTLKKFCEKRKLHLVECDLRWGVPKETSSGQTLQICLGAIDKCIDDNDQPFFLNLLGERYGWIPSEAQIPSDLAEKYHWIKGFSVTAMEIVYGAIRRSNPNALFMIRDSSSLKGLPSEFLSSFVDSDSISKRKLSVLKEQLKQLFPDQTFTYQSLFQMVDRMTQKATFQHLEIFGNKVLEFFKTQIDKKYPLSEGPTDWVVLEQQNHSFFMDTLRTFPVPNSKWLEPIQSYFNDPTYVPLLVSGSAGSGKSTLLAHVAQQYLQDESCNVFYHAVGASPSSWQTSSLIERLSKFLESVIAKLKHESHIQEVSLPTALPTTFANVITNESEENVSFVIIDLANPDYATVGLQTHKNPKQLSYGLTKKFVEI